MQRDGGRLLLLVAQQDAVTTAQLTQASGLSPAETVRTLANLTAHGFIVAMVGPNAVGVYRLNPKGVRTELPPPHQRILLIEDDLAVQDLTITLLEEEGYAVIAAQTPADAAVLLDEVAFDLVITDGFSPTPARAVAANAEVLASSGVTPVVLFTAHRMDLDEVRAAGFRDLIEKPFELETLEQTVRTLLRGVTSQPDT